MSEIEQIRKAMPEATFDLFTEGFSKIDYIRNWTLVGGTALSIHLHHRLSEDLDFFIEKSTLDQENSHIEKMINDLEKQGYNCVRTHSNSENISFEIEGVKVTFFASGLKELKSNFSSYMNIEVASIETIIAMKMEAIISYRTKTRDFYDIYAISENKGINIFTMLDIYNKYSNKKGKEELIYSRFAKKPLDSDDEGLSTMKAKNKNMSTFAKLREWITEEIIKNETEEKKILTDILENQALIKEYNNSYFGFQRISLPQKLASIGQADIVKQCLELNIFDIAYRDISGSNLLDYYLLPEENEMFEKILKHTVVIPQEWLQSKTYKREEKIEAIQRENSIINSVEKNQAKERMILVAEKCNMTIEEYLKKVEEKKRIMTVSEIKSILTEEDKRKTFFSSSPKLKMR
jgi:hypothetical protein